MRKWKLDTDRTREKVALVAAKLKQRMGSIAVHKEYHADSDSDDSSLSSVKAPNRRQSSFGLGSLMMGANDEKQARMELKMIVDSADDSMFCIDEKGNILLTNDAAAKQFGYRKRELKGANISTICNSKDASHHGQYLENYLRTGEKRVMGKKRELKARRKDGSEFYIELGLTEVDLGGGKFIFCGFVKDVTELRHHRRSLDYQHSESFIKNGNTSTKEKKDEGGRSNSRARGIPPLVEWCEPFSHFFHSFIYQVPL